MCTNLSSREHVTFDMWIERESKGKKEGKEGRQAHSFPTLVIGGCILPCT